MPSKRSRTQSHAYGLATHKQGPEGPRGARGVLVAYPNNPDRLSVTNGVSVLSGPSWRTNLYSFERHISGASDKVDRAGSEEYGISDD